MTFRTTNNGSFHSQRSRGLGMMMARILVLSPITGAFIGCVVAYIAFNLQAIYSGSYHRYSFIEMSNHGIPFGLIFGGLSGILALWPLRHAHPARIALFLGGGSLLVGLIFSLIPEFGVMLGWIGTILGFWMGFGLLVSSEASRRVQALQNSVKDTSKDYSG